MPVRGRTAGNGGKGSRWITRRRRLAIYTRDRYACVWCTRAVVLPDGLTSSPDNATLDHFRTRSSGGVHETRNLLTCCMGCNRLRGHQSPKAFASIVAVWTREEARHVLARVRRARRRALAKGNA